MEVLVQWVLMLLAILGLVQLGEMICLWSRRPKKRPASFSVLPVSGRLNDPQTVLDYFEHRRLHFCTQQEFARICKETQDGVY